MRYSIQIILPISLVTFAVFLSSDISILEAKVACDQSNREDNIWGVWLKSPSIDCLPSKTKFGVSFSTIFLKILATANGSTSISPTSTWIALSAPNANDLFKTSWLSFGPIETETI